MKKSISMFWMVFLIIALMVSFAIAQAPETTTKTEPAKTSVAPVATLKVDKIACGTGVTDRELTGQDTVFTETTEKVYCWVTITGGSEGTSVNFVWYRDGKEVTKVPLTANYSRTRTWAYKSMFAGSKGDWKVEVVDSNNNVIGTTAFKVQ
jgi:hypothetical protein